MEMGMGIFVNVFVIRINKMNNNYWKKFYRGKNAEMGPSDFAKSIQEIASKKKLIFDLGSGNSKPCIDMCCNTECLRSL